MNKIVGQGQSRIIIENSYSSIKLEVSIGVQIISSTAPLLLHFISVF